MKVRLDQRLLELKLCDSRSKAQALILAGLVRVDGQVRTKAGVGVNPASRVEVTKPPHPYVSRGGVKLAGALAHFQLSPQGLVCLDVGASTGGFSDCLVQHGAAKVTALDVGYGQLAFKLRQDTRVEVLERVNARQLPPQTAPGPFDLIVVDVSFISLTLVLPSLFSRLRRPEGKLICLVKPQFEAGREMVEKGGVVREQSARLGALLKIQNFVKNMGLSPLDSCESSLTGPAGNREFLLLAGWEN